MPVMKVQTGLRLNESVYDKIRVLASLDHRSINNMIEHILQSYVEEYELENGTIIIDTEE
ncbi:MAG: hypothetical protein J6M20_00985 [Clostridia bacterium]|nr:hypothetical protein [Clostridia bacterium]MBQ7846539.1 hypothetical protein [Clostridia bacterium]